MDNAPEMIRQQMQQTRASLSDRIGTLEQQVVQTVHEATSAVHDTVVNMKETAHETIHTVKESVQDAVQTVRDTVNIRLQVERHPWPMMAGSVAVGFAAGALLPRQIERLRHREPALGLASTPREWSARAETSARNDRAHDGRRSWFSKLAESLGPEIDKLRGIGVGALMGVVRDLVGDATPGKFQSQVRNILNDITTKLGGAPVQGRVMPEQETDTEDLAEHRPTSRMAAADWEARYGG